MGVEIAYVGGAGTGKTHRLIEAIEREAQFRSWPEHEAVLALTFMHGARRRLHHRLGALRARGIAVVVETIDAFCLRVVNRFRRRLGRDLQVVPSNKKGWVLGHRNWGASFGEIRMAALALLAEPVVANCVGASYPLLLVDEFQDCDQHLVGVVAALSSPCRTFLAADPFQYLDMKSLPCPAMDWLEKAAPVSELTEIHRTHEMKLLQAASALRDGGCRAGCIPVVPVTSGGLAAWEISKRLKWNGWRQGATALIAPVNVHTSPFVRDTLASLGRPLGKQKNVGPYPFRWSGTTNDTEKRVMDAVAEHPKANALISRDCLLKVCRCSDDRLARAVCAAAYRRVQLRGEGTIPREELGSLAHIMGTHCPPLAPKRVAMTVHGAKNQEFDRVFVLWPYEVKSDALYARKLLYNAITRAKLDAVVLVQGDGSRQTSDAALSLLLP